MPRATRYRKPSDTLMRRKQGQAGRRFTPPESRRTPGGRKVISDWRRTRRRPRGATMPAKPFKARGLGRGLESLIPAAVRSAVVSPQSTGAVTKTVPIGEIRANRYQPRAHFNEELLRELSDSIREQGLIQPLV